MRGHVPLFVLVTVDFFVAVCLRSVHWRRITRGLLKAVLGGGGGAGAGGKKPKAA